MNKNRQLGFAAAIYSATAVIAVPALAAEPLDLTNPVSLTCETSAVILDAEPFKASQGNVSIEVKLDDTAAPDGLGRWKVTSNGEKHASSFGATAPKSCNPDCPLTQGKDGTIQLWSPKPMALTQISDGETLVLISINKTSLELKASSFRDKQLAALERGECKLAGNDSAEPDNPPASDGNSSPESAKENGRAVEQKQMDAPASSESAIPQTQPDKGGQPEAPKETEDQK